ncbi:MAG: SpoVA/SpoVAEb family sporulation membrane protein [Clostridium sp.]|jgi:stage V sporulation protein AC|nr:SpoVA/SpoVAEb family sporulation membrane protein [Clostridium sp.]
MEVDKKAYGKYVDEITPKHNLPLNMVRAFVTGGAVCTVGQLLLNAFQAQGIEKEAAGSLTLLVLIGASAFLTGLNLYQKLVKFGGAGALVPITGFANSVAAPAIEYKAEGQVFGIGCKIFTIAGPVILYGLFSSWLLGVICWLGKMIGIS